MNILLTGGTGFIGSYLVPALLNAGHQVTILTRSNKKASKPGLDYLQWNGESMPMGIGLHEVVINLAGASIAQLRWSEKTKQEIMESRVKATQACVRYINQSPTPPKLFISASAVGYYGIEYEDEIDERARPGKDFAAEVCHRWEEEAKAATCRTIRPRIGIVLGQDGGALPQLLTVHRLYLGGNLGSGKQGFPWIHIRDIVNAFLFFLEHESIEGSVNLTAPQIVTQGRFSDTLAKILGTAAPWVVPRFALKLLFGEAALLLYGGQKAIPRKLQQERFPFEYPELEPALKQLVRQ